MNSHALTPIAGLMIWPTVHRISGVLSTAHQDSSRARPPVADSMGVLRWVRWACGSAEAVAASRDIEAASSRSRVCSRRMPSSARLLAGQDAHLG